jgi:hypothetical protein
VSDEEPQSMTPKEIAELIASYQTRGVMIERLTKHQIEAALARAKLLSVPPAPPNLPTRVEAESVTPKHWMVSLLKVAGPKAWIVLLVVGTIFGLGGGEGISKIVTSYRADQFRSDLLAARSEIDILKTATSKCVNCCEQAKEATVKIQSDNKQVFSRLGLDWPWPPNTRMERELKFEVPNNRKPLPPIKVDQPMVLPEPTPR